MAVPVTESIDPSRPLLFSPFKIRGLTLKNRLVVPPMVHYRAGPGSTCGMFHNVHLGRYALGGFGLVFVEATAVEEVGLINEHDLGIWNEAQVESFRPLIAFMKGENTAIGIQLAHGGRKSSSQRAMDGMGPLTPQEIEAGAKLWQPVGPTGEPVAPGWLAPRQLTTEECRAMVRTWAAAARNAVKAGFDAIEVHTAHGYLLASFLSPISNTRNDEYGGDRNGRMRLPLEIVEAVRREMPDTMPLFVRVSAVDGARDGWNLDDTVAFAAELKRRGVDVVDCSSGGISGSATAAQVPRGLGFQVPYAERVRKEANIPTMAVGIILEAQQAEEILQEWPGRSHRRRPAIPVQSQHRPALGPRSRHQRKVRGLDSRIWMVAREANANHRRLRHADRDRQAAGVGSLLQARERSLPGYSPHCLLPHHATENLAAGTFKDAGLNAGGAS